MEVSATNHIYANQVGSYYRNERYTTINPIGISDSISIDIINTKSNDLQNHLSNYDLRQITPKDFAKLASNLFEEGEISDVAASEFIGLATLDFKNQSKPIDAIKLFEDKFNYIQEIASDDPTMQDALKYISDSLHTLYNIDDFIRGAREKIGIDTTA